MTIRAIMTPHRGCNFVNCFPLLALSSVVLDVSLHLSHRNSYAKAVERGVGDSAKQLIAPTK
jgi:hypothetical protein